MPSMDWDAFLDAHYRPHLVVATLGSGVEPASDQATGVLLERLAEALRLSGNYAIKHDGDDIRAAFETDADAGRFAGVLMAKTTTRDPEWASRAVGRIDGVAQRKIMGALRQHRLKRPRRR